MSTKQNIIFYDQHWNEVTEAASSKLKNLKALTYDTTHDIFYFTDRHSNLTYINTLKLRNDGTTVINSLIQLTEKEFIEDLVYDFSDDVLFFSDKENQKIVKISFDRSDPDRVKWTQETFLDINSGAPTGLELDACKRILYYTTIDFKDSAIHAVSIKEKKNELICKSCRHHRPLAIALDEKNDRIYIADNQKSNVYVINSFTVNKDDLTEELRSFDRTPRSLAVDHEYVYYLDGTGHSLRRLLKNRENSETSEFLMNFQYDPTDIIVRSNFIDAIGVDLSKCDLTKERMEELQKVNERVKKEEVVCEKPSSSSSSNNNDSPKMSCLHGGTFDVISSSCVCKESRYDGDHCEIDLCYNFCLNGGECSMEKDAKSSRSIPACSCTHSFKGDRCEHDACSNYCINGGICNIDKMRNPSCDCHGKFSGQRCESEYGHVKSQPVDLEAKTITSSTTTTTEDDRSIKIDNENGSKILKCPVRMNLTYVILAVCLTLSLLFFLIILVVIHRFHKPMRPKIRKKYVVHKNIEPMTCRPTTEQCEVIIEDCCNMNICDTVSFFKQFLKI